MDTIAKNKDHTHRFGSDLIGGGTPAGITVAPLLSELRLLLVEDNPGDADLLVHTLKMNGIAPAQIERAARLSEALGLLHEQPVDAVILDLGLPDSAGLEALRAVRAETADAAILVLTGLDDEETGLAAVAEGAEDFLVKGCVDGPALARVLRYAVERQRSRRQVCESERFLLASLDALSAHIAIVDAWGTILFVNQAWRAFSAENDVHPGAVGEGINYLAVCDGVVGPDAEEAADFTRGIREVLQGKRSSFEMEYPCHSPGERRWFIGRVTRFPGGGSARAAIAHENITERKRAEEEMQRLNRSLRILSACNEILVRATDERELLDQVCNVIMDIGGYGLVWVGFAEVDEAKTVRPVAWGARAPKYVENIHVTWDDSAQGRGPAGTAIRSGKTTLTRDTRSDPDFAPWRDAAVENGYLSSIALPLNSPDRVFGALLIYAGQPDAFDQEEAKLLMEMAGDLAYGIMALRTRVERDRAGRALVSSETRYRRLFESAKDGVLILDAATGSIVDVNPFLMEMLGFDQRYFIGRRLWEIGLFKDIAASEAAFLELQEKEYIRYENMPLETRDGRQIEVEFVSNVYLVDGVKVVQCDLRDITQRRRAEAQTALLGAAIECVPDVVIITGQDGTIQYVNPAFKQVTGYSPVEALGNNPRMLKSGRQDEGFYQRLWKTVSAGGVWSGRMVNRRKDGTLYEEEATISPILDSAGRITHYVGIKRDISERIAAEQHQRQAQKLEAVGTLAGGIAHDFNNILAITMGYGLMVLDKLPEDSPLREDMAQILTASDRAKNLVRQILTFSSQGDKDRRPVSLDLIVKEVLEFLRPSLPTTIDIRAEVESMGPLVMADPTQIHQILMNLCTNAYHAMQDRGGKLRIGLGQFTADAAFAEAHPELVEGKYALLTVSDTGSGIAPEIVGRIFDPFFTTKPLGKGTGLGLATVHGIVRAHGGTITVSSEPGRGTTFSVYLPGIEAEQTEAPSPEEPVRGGSESILVVDDEPSLARMLGKVLKMLGYKVQALNSSTAALALFCDQPDQFDLIITDQTMPDMTGEELASRALALRPGMPIVIITGYSDRMTAEKAGQMGISGFLAKPADTRKIAKMVRDVLDRHQNNPSGGEAAFGTGASAD